MRRVDKALLALGQARRRCATTELPSPEELTARWPTLTIAERREQIRQTFDTIFVLRRESGPVEQRLHVFLRGTAPPGLPTHRPYLITGTEPVDLDSAPTSPG